MSAPRVPIACEVPAVSGWRALIRDVPKVGVAVYATVPVARWAMAIHDGALCEGGGYPGELLPLSFAGERLNERPGYFGLARPEESNDAAVARIREQDTEVIG